MKCSPMPPREPTAVIFDWLMPLHYTSEHHWSQVPHRYDLDARYSAFPMEHKKETMASREYKSVGPYYTRSAALYGMDTVPTPYNTYAVWYRFSYLWSMRLHCNWICYLNY